MEHFYCKKKNGSKKSVCLVFMAFAMLLKIGYIVIQYEYNVIEVIVIGLI